LDGIVGVVGFCLGIYMESTFKGTRFFDCPEEKSYCNHFEQTK
jgi:hypothetical protein